MNFQDAIVAHVSWKMKLSRYIQKPDKSLDSAKVEADNNCDLGKWIYGEGVKFSTDPKFKELVAEHAKFHKAAAGIIRRADSGVSVMEEVALGAKSDYAKQTENVIRILMDLKSAYNK